jgi:hypothetical protein
MTAVRARADSVVQQSEPLAAGAHSWPSLQQAICALCGISASAHAAQSDQLRAVATTSANNGNAAFRENIDFLIVGAGTADCQIWPA